MSAPNDGGPAFPNLELRHTCGDPIIEASTGMSLRDWFAGQALAGWLAVETGTIMGYEPSIAKGCYDLADAMLAEREKGGVE